MKVYSSIFFSLELGGGGGGAFEFSVTGLCPSKTFSSPNEGIFRVNRHPIGEFFIGNDTQ